MCVWAPSVQWQCRLTGLAAIRCSADSLLDVQASIAYITQLREVPCTIRSLHVASSEARAYKAAQHIVKQIAAGAAGTAAWDAAVLQMCAARLDSSFSKVAEAAEPDAA